MILTKGDMLRTLSLEETYLVTTNSYIRRDGALVMGRGAAKQLATRFPIRVFQKLPYEFGKRINHLGEYNIIVLTDPDTGLRLGAFQVKYHFKDAADLALIERSVDELASIAHERSERKFNVNFPGIGNGKLDYDQVLPLLERLPDNVYVWTFH